MYYTYAIVSKDRSRIYIGLTQNLETRIKDHNFGRTKSTKHFRPWMLFYYESLPTRLEARTREKELKTSPGRRFLNNKLKMSL